ncbi:hypothetical protein [Solicola sp. PLA-1-18]|uniref:hypothetical protein n=1 Tax=Solicola sp. PLA-1-18 TaxID=3380532 RepID=UPI003B777FAC
MSTSGTFRIGDGAPVPFATAAELWVRAARDVLRETAGRYHAAIDEGELAKQVQARSGVRTRTPASMWLERILALLAHECHQRGEPLLTSLCTRTDGLALGVYAVTARPDGSPLVGDVEQHAAEQRLECYVRHGASLPSDGGVPDVHRGAGVKSSARAARSKAAATVATPRRIEEARTGTVCPRCFTEMSLTGSCGVCD